MWHFLERQLIKTDKIYFITQDNDIISVYDIDIVVTAV